MDRRRAGEPPQVLADRREVPAIRSTPAKLAATATLVGVFYDALGHFSTTWSDPRQLALAAGGIEWAAGLVGGGDC